MLIFDVGSTASKQLRLSIKTMSARSLAKIILDLPSHLICFIYSFVPELRASHVRVCNLFLQILTSRNEEVHLFAPLRPQTSFRDNEFALEYAARFLLRFSLCRIHFHGQWNSAALPPLIHAIRSGLNSIVMLDVSGGMLDSSPGT